LSVRVSPRGIDLAARSISFAEPGVSLRYSSWMAVLSCSDTAPRAPPAGPTLPPATRLTFAYRLVDMQHTGGVPRDASDSPSASGSPAARSRARPRQRLATLARAREVHGQPAAGAVLGEDHAVHVEGRPGAHPALEHVPQDGLGAANPLPGGEQRVADRLDLALAAVGVDHARRGRGTREPAANPLGGIAGIVGEVEDAQRRGTRPVDDLGGRAAAQAPRAARVREQAKRAEAQRVGAPEHLHAVDVDGL